jgi:hypothetical protein
MRTRYKIVKLALDSTGLAVVEPGTVLVLQKGGILGVPPISAVTCPARYQDDELHAPTGFCAAMVKQTSRYFQATEKVYASKIDVNVKKEQISFRIVACDACNATNPPTFFKSEVLFQFPKGYLETAVASHVEDLIGKVLAVDAGKAEQAQAPPAADPAAATVGDPSPAPDAPAAPPAIAAPAAPTDAPTQTIEVGQTVDQVVAALGQPQRIAKAGAKQIYFYEDLKVIFTNGAVSDVD